MLLLRSTAMFSSAKGVLLTSRHICLEQLTFESCSTAWHGAGYSSCHQGKSASLGQGTRKPDIIDMRGPLKSWADRKTALGMSEGELQLNYKFYTY